MAPGPSKKKAGAGGTFLGIALFVAALCIAAGIAFVYYNERNRPGLDAATLCPQNGPVAHLAILVDTTDPLTLTHLQSARQIIEQRVADAAVGTRISFSTVSLSANIPETLAPLGITVGRWKVKTNDWRKRHDDIEWVSCPRTGG